MSAQAVDLHWASCNLVFFFLIDWQTVTSLVTCVFVHLCCSPGRAASTWKWVKFQAFSHISNHSASSLSLLQLISHLMCARGLCQAHWQWKNNLTGFNLFLPPTPSSLPPFLSFFFFFCVRLGGLEFILFANFHAQTELALQAWPAFTTTSGPPVRSWMYLECSRLWKKKKMFSFFFPLHNSTNLQFCHMLKSLASTIKNQNAELHKLQKGIWLPTVVQP